MWNAIKSDLFDFVATIQEDTTKTISKVLGDDEEEENSDVMQEKIAKDVRRSFETYGTAIGDVNLKKFQRFLKTFSLGAYAHDIGFVLDDEPEVSRFYAELVPAQITPEEFWSRLFFRLNLVYRNESVEEVDEDDEEELVWDAEEVTATDATTMTTVKSSDGTTLSHSQSVQSLLDHPAGSNNAAVTSDEKVALASALKRVTELENENGRLNSQVRTLVRRVAELEQQVQATEKTSAPKEDSSQRRNNQSDEPVQPQTAPLDTVRKTSDAGSIASSSDSASSHSSSGVVVNTNGDTFSLTDDDSRHGNGNGNNATANNSSASTTGAKTSTVTATQGIANSVTSKTTATYLAAVDDEDDEDGGWN